MRYVLAGSVVFLGAMLIGLAYHDTVTAAWQALTAPTQTTKGQG